MCSVDTLPVSLSSSMSAVLVFCEEITFRLIGTSPVNYWEASPEQKKKASVNVASLGRLRRPPFERRAVSEDLPPEVWLPTLSDDKRLLYAARSRVLLDEPLVVGESRQPHWWQIPTGGRSSDCAGGDR